MMLNNGWELCVVLPAVYSAIIALYTAGRTTHNYLSLLSSAPKRPYKSISADAPTFR